MIIQKEEKQSPVTCKLTCKSLAIYRYFENRLLELVVLWRSCRRDLSEPEATVSLGLREYSELPLSEVDVAYVRKNNI